MAIEVLVAHQLGQDFPGVRLFESLNLSVAEGEQVAIVGRSGSGKTTLLNLLAGLSLPSQGEVRLCGQAYPHSATARDHWRAGRLGMVFQFHHLLGEFSAQENVALGLQLAGSSKKQAMTQAAEWLERVGLGHRIDHVPAQLSGGERQRVAIARALAPAPPVVLMDEPTGNLDSQTTDEIQGLLKTLVREASLALVIVTHDRELAGGADRVLTLSNGQLA